MLIISAQTKNHQKIFSISPNIFAWNLRLPIFWKLRGTVLEPVFHFCVIGLVTGKLAIMLNIHNK